MTTLIHSDYNALISRISQLESMLTALYSAYTSGTTEIESYEFDNGAGGRQKTKYRSLSQVWDAIQRIESTLSGLRRKLNGTGIVNMNLRRR